MTNKNLTAVLQGSLDMINENPLTEATTDSIDALMEKINSACVEGLPGKITDEDLLRFIQIWRAKALQWAQEEQAKANKPSRKKTEPTTYELDLDL